MKSKITLIVCLMLYFSSFQLYAGQIHLFYMHGYKLDGGGGKKGEKKGYKNIISKFKAKGYKVISEIRGNQGVEEYSDKITRQVNELLSSGVAPSDIVVSGFSKGAVITLISATKLKNKNIKYVALAGCTDRFDVDYEALSGNILSIFDLGDAKFGSCEEDISDSEQVSFKEVMLDTGYGHKSFKMKKGKHIRKWMDPMVEWIENE